MLDQIARLLTGGGAIYNGDGTIYIDYPWLDTIAVLGLTCFILCLMDLSKVGCVEIFVSDLCSRRRTSMNYRLSYF